MEGIAENHRSVPYLVFVLCLATTMSESSRMSGEAFATERLRHDSQLSFESLRQAAEQAGITLQPIQYGRARRQLGLTSIPPVATPAAAVGAIASSASSNGTAIGASTTASAPDTHHDLTQVDDAPAADSPTADSPAADAPAADAPAADAPAAPARPSSKRKGSPAFDYLVESLREEPKLAYGELQARCAAKGYKIAPIMYGRAKALLGLVPVAPRGQGKNRKASKLTSQQTLKQADSASADQFGEQLSRVRNVEDLVQIIKHLDGERRRLRSLLQNIANSIDEALDQGSESGS